jgi:hypothetical protein
MPRRRAHLLAAGRRQMRIDDAGIDAGAAEMDVELGLAVADEDHG